jgi:hypothetical protein
MEPHQLLKQLSYELLDMGLHSGQRGLSILQQTRAYQFSDGYLHYQRRFDQLRARSQQYYSALRERLYLPAREAVVVVWDQTGKVVSFLVKVVKENQDKLAAYVKARYENVAVFA